MRFTEDKVHFEKRHMPEGGIESTKTFDNPKLTKVTFERHNRNTLKETRVINSMLMIRQITSKQL